MHKDGCCDGQATKENDSLHSMPLQCFVSPRERPKPRSPRMQEENNPLDRHIRNNQYKDYTVLTLHVLLMIVAKKEKNLLLLLAMGI